MPMILKQFRVLGGRPLVNPEGTHVGFGNGWSRVLDLTTGQVTDVNVTEPNAPAGWHEGRLVQSVYRGTPEAPERELKGGPITPPWTQRPGSYPQRAVAGGQLVSSAPDDHGRKRHYLNGEAASYEVGRLGDIECLSRNGAYYMYKRTDDWSAAVCLALGTSSELQHEVPSPLGAALSNTIVEGPRYRPRLLANHDGRAVLLRPLFDAVYFQPGETRGTVVFHPITGACYVITCGQDLHEGNRPFVMIRREEDCPNGPGVLLKDLWWAEMDAVIRPDGVLVYAGYYNEGDLPLDVALVDLTAARVTLEFTPAPPVHVPTPPVVTPPVTKPEEKPPVVDIPDPPVVYIPPPTTPPPAPKPTWKQQLAKFFLGWLKGR